MQNTLLERSGTFWSIAALIGLLFAVTNLPWHLDDYDQAKQAYTSFEMTQDGHWLHQHTPNEKIATKPPLVGWVSAALFELTRSWELAWRLPSITAALALMFFLTRAAQRSYGSAPGLLALSAFGLNLLSPRLATLVRTDMPLALVIFLLGLKIWEKLRSAEPWQPRDRAVMFALLTAAMLIKGPIVYAFLLPGILAFQWSRRTTRAIPSAWCGWWPWIASLAVFLIWVIGGITYAPGFYEQVVLREFAGRFGETIHRPQPFYFYLPHLLHKFAPWSVLMIALGVVGWRMEKAKLMDRWRSLSPETVWLVCWSLGGLLLMSLIPSKRVDRIFPVVPPLCLLLAAQFAYLTSNNAIAPRVRTWGLISLIVACFSTTIYAAARIGYGYKSGEVALVDFGAAVRGEAVAKNWRLEVIGGEEEGLLLYLRRPHFIRIPDAIERWKNGSLDAVVMPAAELPNLVPNLPNADVTGMEASVTINGRLRHYVLVAKRPASSQVE